MQRTLIQYLTQSKFQEIAEGGHALSVMVSRITQANAKASIADCIRNLSRQFHLPAGAMEPLGSAGKKLPHNTSGDLDIALDWRAVAKHFGTKTEKETASALQHVLHTQFGEAKILMGGAIVSFALPISNVDGSQPGEVVQCDLMFTEDPSYAKFGYHSPAEVDSKYKGLYRNEILFAIAAHANPQDGQPAADGSFVRTRVWFDTANGLLSGQQRIFPNGKKVMIARVVVTRNPADVVKILLGPTFKVSDADSFETLWKAIHSPKFIDRKKLPAIVATIKETLSKKKAPLPDEMQ